jgi:hypothetical protein
MPYGYGSNYRHKTGYPPSPPDTGVPDNVVDGADNVKDGSDEVTD